MTQVSIKDQLKKLVDVQKLDVQIYEFKKELNELPLEIEKLKIEFETKKTHLKNLEEALKKVLVDRKAKEVELQAKEGDIVKANGQLSLLKSNKEYHAKMTEIESLKADKSIIEEKILEFFDEVDKVNAQINKEKEVVAQEEKGFLVRKKEVDDKVQSLTEKMKILEGERLHLTPGIDPIIFKQYSRILENKEGIGIVPVQGHMCGGCYMNFPMQTVNRIKMNDQIVCCEMCARILYIPEDL